MPYRKHYDRMRARDLRPHGVRALLDRVRKLWRLVVKTVRQYADIRLLRLSVTCEWLIAPVLRLYVRTLRY